MISISKHIYHSNEVTMMYKTKEIIGKLSSAVSNPSNHKYAAYSLAANPSQPNALQNQFEILTHHNNYPYF